VFVPTRSERPLLAYRLRPVSAVLRTFGADRV